MTTSHVEVPGGNLLVIDEGTGSPIVLVATSIVRNR
jgi:hypothetical protein